MKSSVSKVLLSVGVLTSSTIGLGAVGFPDAHAKEPVKQTTQQTPVQDEHHIDVKGENIYYNATIKNPNQKTLVFIHGAGAFAESWNGVFSKFTSDDFNYVALDMPGHLRSGGELRYSIDDNADFINDFVKALQKKYNLKNDFTLVGHSFGGAVTGEVATRHYDWLKSVVLVGTSSDFTQVSSPEFINDLSNGVMDLDFYHRGFSPSTPSYYFDGLVNAVSRVSIQAAYADFYSTTLYNNTDNFKNINKDTLIIQGNDDIIMPQGAAELMHEKIKHSTLLKLDNAGHFITTEKPTEVANAIQNFLTK